jgi:hypothetical protein
MAAIQTAEAGESLVCPVLVAQVAPVQFLAAAAAEAVTLVEAAAGQILTLAVQMLAEVAEGPLGHLAQKQTQSHIQLDTALALVWRLSAM